MSVEPLIPPDEQGEFWVPGLAELLDEVAALIRRPVVLTSAQADAVALWAAHSHALNSASFSPLLAISSAEMRSGKTTLMKLLSGLCPRPWPVVEPSEAVVYRKIDRDRPTLLLDEYDAIFKKRDNEHLRALLNAGNEPDTKVPRCVGQSHQLKDFDVFCTKALAGIGKLPATVADRSIEVKLQRKAPNEQCERIRRRQLAEVAHPFHDRLAEWADDAGETLASLQPALPEELDDRAQDNWEPLLAIADLAGGEWPARARKAALAISTGLIREDESSPRLRLLRDIRAVFDAERVEKLATATLIEKLSAIEESPWGDWFGKPITPQKLSGLVKGFDVGNTRDVWEDSRSLKGYERQQFEDAWTRWLPTEKPRDPREPRGAAPVKEAEPRVSRAPRASAGTNGHLTDHEAAVVARHPELFPVGTPVEQIRDFLPSVLAVEARAHSTTTDAHTKEVTR